VYRRNQHDAKSASPFGNYDERGADAGPSDQLVLEQKGEERARHPRQALACRQRRAEESQGT
jgi:hypothetical protein